MDKVLFRTDLNFLPIQDILQWIDMNRITCVVSITLKIEREIVIYVESGKIISASSKRKGLSFSELLVRSGKFNESEVVHALSESRLSGVSLIRYLADNDLIPLSELTKLFNQFMEALMLEIFNQTSGNVLITTVIPPSIVGSPIQLDIVRVLFDSVVLFDEHNRDNTQQRNEAIEALNKRLYDEDFQLPVLPSILMQLISLMEDENTTFQDIARLIMTDQVLISRVLKIANSPIYGGTGQVDSIHLAIVRLGMREILNIVTAIKLNSINYAGVAQEKMQELMDNALKTAFLATGLARLCRVDPDEAFLGGLLLDLGKTVILSVAKDLNIEEELLEDLMASKHADLGALIAKKWNYPESIQNLIRYHHLKNLGGVVNKIHSVIQIADNLVFSEGLYVPETELLETLELKTEDIANTYNSAIELFHQIKSL